MMKKILAGAALAAMVALSAWTVQAGGACCGAAKADGAAMKKADACAAGFAKLNLTEEQKTKVAALQADCKKAGCSAESNAAMMKGLEQILTAEQLAACKAECTKAAGSCPMSAAPAAAPAAPAAE